MRKPFKFLVYTTFLLTTLVGQAQYTETLNSNKPGGSQGAFSVGTNVLQFEGGISFGKEKHNLLQTDTRATTFDWGVRYGFWKEELEISWIGQFDFQTVDYTGGSFKQSNFRSNTIGAKYLFYDPYKKMEQKGPNLYSWKANYKFQWADLIPAISFYAGANIDFSDNPFTPEPEGKISPKFVLATQNNWIGGWAFVTNIIVDRVTTDFPTYGYIITLTHTPTDWFSVFIENQGFKSDFYADQILRAGAGALLTEDWQIDLSATVNFKDTPSLFYIRVGAAYRFDMHNRDEYLEDKLKKSKSEKKADKELKKAAKKKKKKSKKRKDDFNIDDNEGEK
jgi:hypothetical protein